MLHRRKKVLSAALAAAAPIVLAFPCPAQVVWTGGTLEEALERAREERRVVMVAVDMDGTLASAQLFSGHYVDQRLGRLSQATINLFASMYRHAEEGECTKAPAVTCEEHMAVEKEARTAFLKADRDGYVIAPQHVFLSPEGAVLTSVPWMLTQGELEWAWVDAIRRLDPKFKWELPRQARAPRRLIVGGTAWPAEEDQPPPPPEQVAEAVGRIRRAGADWREAITEMELILRSPDEGARRFVRGVLSNAFVPNDVRTNLLRQIGRLSPLVWWEEVTPYLVWRDSTEVRREAAVALEQLAERRAADALLRAWSREPSEEVKGDILRALGRIGAGNPRIVSTLREQITKTRPRPEPLPLRVNAVVALAGLEDRTVVLPLIEAALKDPEPKLRSAAAYVAAVRREHEAMEALRQAFNAEEDQEVSSHLLAAIGAVETGDASRFDRFLRDAVPDEIPRDRR